MQETTTGSTTTMSEKPVRGAFWRLQGIFFEPAATFEDINRHPTFLVPLIVCILLAAGTMVSIGLIVDFEDLAINQIKASPQGADLTDEQIQQAAGFQAIAMKWLSPIISPIMLLAISGVLLLLTVLFGGETSFRKVFSVVTTTFVLQGLVRGVLTTLVFAVSSDPAAIDLQNPVSTNLGFLVDRKESAGLYALSSWVDIIAFYVIYLLGLGISKVSRGIKLGTGITVVAIPYLLVALIAAGFAAAFA